MLLIALATPGELGRIGLNAAVAVIEAAQGQHSTHVASHLEALQSFWAGRTSDNIVITADTPEDWLLKIVVDRHAPLVAILEPPADLAHRLAELRGFDADAIRKASASYSAIAQAVTGSGVAPVGHDWTGLTIGELMLRHCQMLQLSLSDEQARAVLARLAGNRATGFRTPLVEIARETGAIEARHDAAETAQLGARVGSEALGGFAPLLHGLECASFTWPLELFSCAQPHGSPPTRPLDMTGGARVMAWGPYLHLPPGDWIATADLTVTGNVGGNILKIDVVADATHVVCEGEGTLPWEGAFAGKLPFTLMRQAAIEIRFFIGQGSIGGTIQLWGVRIERADRSAD